MGKVHIHFEVPNALKDWLEAQFNQLKELIMATKEEVAAGIADLKAGEEAEAQVLGSVATIVATVQTDVALLLDKIANFPQVGATPAELQAFADEVAAIKTRQAANNEALLAAQAALQATDAAVNPPA